MLVSKIILNAHKLLGIVTTGEDISTDEYNDGLEIFNDMISHFNNQNLLCAQSVDSEYLAPSMVSPFDPNYNPTNNTRAWKRKIKIGTPDGDYAKTPPSEVEMIYFLGSSSDKNIVNIVSQELLVPKKQDIEGIPSQAVVTKGEDNSVIIEFDRIPPEGYILHIISKYPFVSEADTSRVEYGLTDDLKLNFGYNKLLKYSLAIELSFLYGVPIPKLIIEIADATLLEIKQNNFRPKDMSIDSTLVNSNRRKTKLFS